MPKSKKNRSKAREIALAGDYQSALSMLEKESADGNKQAKIGLMYLYGYLDRWDDLVVASLPALEADKDSFYAANVFDEAVLLVATAGQKTGKWSDIKDFLQENLKCIKYGPRLKLVLGELYKYLDQKGKSDRKVFPVVELEGEVKDPKKQAELYQNVLTNVFKIKPKLKDPSKKEELRYYLFSMAQTYNQEKEMIKNYNQESSLFGYQQALDMAKVYAQNGKLDKAWEIFSAKISDWFPVDEVQLMPVEPLVDDDLSKMMDSKRAIFLLKSPKCGGLE